MSRTFSGVNEERAGSFMRILFFVSSGVIVSTLVVLGSFQSAFAQICVVKTYAGAYGSPDLSGDDGDATSAKFNYFQGGGGIWVDTSQTVFIADTKNNRVRTVDHDTKVLTTIAGLCLQWIFFY
jgi:hypothetical protein